MGRAPVDNVEVDDEKALPEKETGVGDSATKLHALILSVAPSSRSTPRRPVPTSIEWHCTPCPFAVVLLGFNQTNNVHARSHLKRRRRAGDERFHVVNHTRIHTNSLTATLRRRA
jgi:hypothetical protein